MTKVFNIFFFLAISRIFVSQSLFYNDIVKGGVIGTGFSPNYFDTIYTGTFNVPIIPVGSNISKAFLFAGRLGTADSLTVSFNGDSYLFNESNSIGDGFYSSIYGGISKLHMVDVTNSISIFQSIYNFSSLSVSNIISNRFSDFYLVIVYENTSMSATEIIINMNSNSFEPIVNESIPLNNPLLLNFDVGLSLFNGYICDSNVDGTDIKINGVFVGTIGGNDSGDGICGGPHGDFYYGNNVLNGMDGDNSNLQLIDTDLISNINTLVTTNSVSIEQTTTNVDNFSNSYWLKLIVGASSCDTFSVEVPSDTSICQGTSLQLNCSGGQMYEWTPTNNLSCSDCPNPIFTGDSSSFYTVRIWNNDSCSVIRPLKINILKNPIIESITSQSSECGYNSGSIDLTANIAAIMPITFLLNDTLSNAIGSFQNLSAGVYSLNIIDGNGCWSGDTTITVGEQNSTSAFFTTNTNYGASPLNIIIDNSSENATNFVWEINNLDFGNSLNSVTFDTSGIYTLQLVAWQFDPACADTFSMVINVVDSLIIPTLFTPNSDGKNDVWTISSIDQLYPDNQIIIFNRWGSVVFESKKGEYFGNEWNGTYQGNELPFGTYFYIMNTGIIDKVYTGYVSLIR